MRDGIINLEFVFGVSEGSKYMLWSDTTFKKTFKALFNTLCIWYSFCRNYLIRHSRSIEF